MPRRPSVSVTKHCPSGRSALTRFAVGDGCCGLSVARHVDTPTRAERVKTGRAPKRVRCHPIASPIFREAEVGASQPPSVGTPRSPPSVGAPASYDDFTTDTQARNLTEISQIVILRIARSSSFKARRMCCLGVEPARRRTRAGFSVKSILVLIVESELVAAKKRESLKASQGAKLMPCDRKASITSRSWIPRLSNWMRAGGVY